MQLRDVLETELDPWTSLDTAWNDDDPWDEESFGAEAVPGSDDELEAVERWLEANPLDEEPWGDGQEVAIDLLH